eukprot:4469293-Pyramimonas_sp.AAC.2
MLAGGRPPGLAVRLSPAIALRRLEKRSPGGRGEGGGGGGRPLEPSHARKPGGRQLLDRLRQSPSPPQQLRRQQPR